jgi:UDPglucose 6-dehydrogenase
VQYHHAAEEMADGCDALLLMTEWEQFRDLPWARIAPHVSRRLILDTRNLLDPETLEAAGLTHLALGR